MSSCSFLYSVHHFDIILEHYAYYNEKFIVSRYDSNLTSWSINQCFVNKSLSEYSIDICVCKNSVIKWSCKMNWHYLKIRIFVGKSFILNCFNWRQAIFSQLFYKKLRDNCQTKPKIIYIGSIYTPRKKAKLRELCSIRHAKYFNTHLSRRDNFFVHQTTTKKVENFFFTFAARSRTLNKNKKNVMCQKFLVS